jgi:hypothetical protein
MDLATDHSAVGLKWLVGVQLVVAAALMFAAPGGYHAVIGILFGQATLLGIWVAAARTGRAEGDGVALLAAVLLSLALGSRGGGWTLLLFVARIAVAVGYYGIKFVRRGIRLALRGDPLTEHLLRVPLRLLFAATILTALFFGLGSVLSDRGGGPFNTVLLVLLIALLGVGYAAMSILASLAALEPQLTPEKLAVYAVVIGGFAAMFGGITYWQTSSTDGAIAFGLSSLLESVWVAGSLALARVVGLNLRHVAIGE